ncbi:Small ribosomal subunit protein uS10 domain - like 1, partial [Theobroma cacao]
MYLILVIKRHSVWTKEILTMAHAPIKHTKSGVEESHEQIHRIKITLTTKNVKSTNTWDRFELRIHKRLIDLYSNYSGA